MSNLKKHYLYHVHPMQKLSNKLTCNVSIEILTQRLINCPNHILHTWNLFDSSAISEKVGQEARVTMAKAPLQCIRLLYPQTSTIQCLCGRYLSRINVVRKSHNAELHKPKTCTGHNIIQMSIIFFTAGTKHQNLDIGQYVKLHA